nr:hypothetical protein [Tanacetum cinerariifolium]
MWYFPIIPRLQRLFKIQSISKDLRWHATHRITDGVLRHPVDSQAWRIIDEKFPKIAKDPRNLRLRISADGVDVNTRNRHHNTEVDTYDVSIKDNFNLRIVVLWTINDYPALEKNVVESIVETLLHVPGKAKDGVNARFDLAELGVKPKLFAMQKEDETTLPLSEGCIAEETIVKETIEFFSEYNKSIETIGIPLDKHETDENEEEKPLSVSKSSEVSLKLFQKACLYVIHNTDEISSYI